MRRFECHACGLVFRVDTFPADVHFCVLCGHHDIKIDAGETVPCANCDREVVFLDRFKCQASSDCDAPLCADCQDTACRTCFDRLVTISATGSVN
jgi:hypothetical protein